MNAEIGYWLAEPFWGQGITTEAVKRMVVYAFENFQVTRLYAKCFGYNKASHRVLEKVGFKVEAHFKNTLIKNEEIFDEVLYALRKEDFKPNLYIRAINYYKGTSKNYNSRK